ncbi:hypothetical protein BJY04DRAFT_222873 [Aspergillus karnatakaensis]|uniref:FAD-dependent oxidoreductase n=1 Tax=Aspergillus karnatakaensis TaxID=1810916 RepID=UPI003CCCD5FB
MDILRRLSGLFLGRGPAGADPSTATVLIVGAGSTGLALAQGLKKAGFPCIVVEKHPSLHAHPRDWNMGLHWGASSLRSLLPDETWPRIQSVQVDPSTPTAETDAIKFLNGQTGQLLNSIPANNFYRLRRRKLRALLSENIDIRYNHSLKTITYSPDGKTATAHFSNGSRITADIIVGTDGARSTTRSLLAPETESLRTLPYCATFIQARYTASQALFLRSFHPLYLACIHPDGYFAFFGLHDVPDAERPETWTFFFYISWHSPLPEQEETKDWSQKQRLAQAKAFAKGFTEPWKSAYEWLPDDQQVWYMSLTEFDPGEGGHRWDNHGGRVTLAGDAAHAMTYQRGQGLNHSVTDAARLAGAIGEVVARRMERGEAIGGYEREMVSRAGEEVRMSTRNTQMVHDWEKVVASPLMQRGMGRAGEGSGRDTEE